MAHCNTLVFKQRAILQGTLAMSGDIFGFHHHGLRGAAGIRWVETKDGAQQPTMYRPAPAQDCLPKMSMAWRL